MKLLNKVNNNILLISIEGHLMQEWFFGPKQRHVAVFGFKSDGIFINIYTFSFRQGASCKRFSGKHEDLPQRIVLTDE